MEEHEKKCDQDGVYVVVAIWHDGHRGHVEHECVQAICADYAEAKRVIAEECVWAPGQEQIKIERWPLNHLRYIAAGQPVLVARQGWYLRRPSNSCLSAEYRIETPDGLPLRKPCVEPDIEIKMRRMGHSYFRVGPERGQDPGS